MDKLKPCPFCRGEASLRLFFGGRYGVYCDHCSSRVGGSFDTEQEAVFAWNRRAKLAYVEVKMPKETQERIEQMVHDEVRDTFNELYHHRAMLFSVIVHDHPEIAWKSKKHHDGSMYDGMFIVGLDTPWGQATYRYDIVPYWNQFDCKELDSAPEWDGHTPDEAIARIGALSSLDAATVGAGTCHEVVDKSKDWYTTDVSHVIDQYGGRDE